MSECLIKSAELGLDQVQPDFQEMEASGQHDPILTWHSYHCQLTLVPCVSPPCLITVSISSGYNALSSNSLTDAPPVPALDLQTIM